MSKAKKKIASWVVYRMTLRGNKGQVNAVCDQSEWDAIEKLNPGFHTLIRSGIVTEGEAEQFARTAVGVAVPVAR